MEELIKTFRELDEFVYRNMGKVNQISIDVVQEFGIELLNNQEVDNSDYFGAFLYDLQNVLEVMNPELKDDILVFKSLLKISEQECLKRFPVKVR